MMREAKGTSTTARAILDATMTEKAFSQLVVDTARAFHWQVYRTWNSIHSPSGFPDIVAVRGRTAELIFAELKREGKEPTRAQEEWIALLQLAGQRVYIWHPSDWPEIEEVLK